MYAKYHAQSLVSIRDWECVPTVWSAAERSHADEGHFRMCLFTVSIFRLFPFTECECFIGQHQTFCFIAKAVIIANHCLELMPRGTDFFTGTGTIHSYCPFHCSVSLMGSDILRAIQIDCAVLFTWCKKTLFTSLHSSFWFMLHTNCIFICSQR